MIKPIFYYVSHFNVAATGGAKPRFQGLCVYKSRHTYLGQDLEPLFKEEASLRELQSEPIPLGHEFQACA